MLFRSDYKFTFNPSMTLELEGLISVYDSL